MKVKWLFQKEIEIPDDWEWEQLLDNSTLKGRIGWQGLTSSEYRDKGKFVLVTGTDFDNGRINWDTCVYVDEERYAQDPHIQLKKHDILITKDGTIGKIAYVDNVPLPSTLNTGVFVVRPINKRYFPLFLYYILQSDYFIKFITRIRAGSTINHLYQKDFVYFHFPIPKIEEQEKIASVLSNIDELILKQQQVIEKTQKLMKGQMQKLFSQGIDHKKFKDIEVKPRFIKYSIPEKWEISDLKTVSNKIADMDHKMPNKTNYGVKFIAANNLENEEIDFDNAELISEEDYLKQSKKFNAEKNDILISRIGSIGVARKIRTDEKFIASYSVALIKPKISIDSEFLHYYLNSTLPQKVMKAYTIVSGNVNLVLGALEKVPVLLPEIDEQEKIGKILRNLDLLIQQEKNYKVKLEKIKKGLVMQLLTGEIRCKV